MKKVAALLFVIFAGLLVTPLVTYPSSGVQGFNLEVTRIEMEGVGYIYYGNHLKDPPDAERYRDLIKLQYAEWRVEIPEVYKLYVLPYETFEEVLSAFNSNYEQERLYWLDQYKLQEDSIAYAFIDVGARDRGEVIIYTFELNYPALIHENLHYILHHSSTNGWMDRHNIIQQMERGFIASNVFRQWLRDNY